jgi:hypothetical protein
VVRFNWPFRVPIKKLPLFFLPLYGDSSYV